MGAPIVVALNGVLALLLSSLRAYQAATLGVVETVAYAIGYAGCSLLFFFVIILGGAFLIARTTGRRLRPVLVKVAFWSGLTWVPLLLLLLALSAALRQLR